MLDRVAVEFRGNILESYIVVKFGCLNTITTEVAMAKYAKIAYNRHTLAAVSGG